MFGFVSPSLRNVLLVITMLGLIEIFLVIRIPFVNADIINALVYSQWDSFKFWGTVLIFLFFGQLLIGFCNKYLLVLFNENMEKNIRSNLFGYILSQPSTFSESHTTGDILSRILNDTPKIKGFITGVALQFCFDFIAVVIAFSILIHKSWVLSLIVFAFAPMAIISGAFFKSKISATSREVQETVAVFTSKVQTWVNRFALLKIYGVETASYRQFNRDSLKYTNAAIRSGKWNILMTAINAVFLGSPSVLVLIVGGYYCLQGQLSVGELFAFLTFSTYFIAPLQRIIAIINVELPRIYPIYQRFKEFGIKESEINFTNNNYLSKTHQKFRFILSNSCHKKTNYPLEITDLEYQKNDFRLSVPYMSFHLGNIYGISGINGAGKSTLAKILKGVLLPKSGKINCSDNETYLLSQDAFFFDGSLMENVTLFDSDCDIAKYKKIIKILDIEKYEELFVETTNAELSRRLSGGELQKINIARLMYSNRPVLILDEPDSFTDASTKSILKNWISEMKHDKVIIVITHDKELLNICDMVYSIELFESKHYIIR